MPCWLHRGTFRPSGMLQKHGMADLVEGATGLEAAERIARHDLARLNYPPANWVPERIGPDGRRVLDVLVVGAGMCGQTAGWNLLREGIRNIRVIERNGHGREGPWNTTARMPILRSPKHLTGPDLGVPVPHLPRLVRGAARQRRLGEALQGEATRLAGLPPMGAEGRRPAGRERRGADERRARRQSPEGARCRPARSSTSASSCWPTAATARAASSGPASPRSIPTSPSARARSSTRSEEIDFAQIRRQAHRRAGRARDGDRQHRDRARSRRARGDLLCPPPAPAAGQQVEGRVVPRLPARPGHARRRLALEDLHLHAGRPARRRRTNRCCGCRSCRASPSASPSRGST